MTPTPNMPIALPRSWGGKAMKMTFRPSGWTSPAQAPCTARASTTTSNVGASWPNMDDPVNSAEARMKVLRGPRLRTNQAFSSMHTVVAERNPVISQCTRSWPTP